MRLSIRAKVFGTYALLALLVMVVLFTGLSRLKRIGSRLNTIQGSYLPIVKTINSFYNFAHLDETFDVELLKANRSNRLFIDSITIASPKLLEQKLKGALAEARATSRRPTPEELHQFDRLDSLGADLLNQHQRYVDAILQTVRELGVGENPNVDKVATDMAQQKRVVRSRIELLSRQLDQRIQSAIHSTVIEERNAVFWQIGLATVTLVLALLIGLITLFSLRPLAELKETARQIAQGDLRQRAAVQSTDEVGELAQEFNRMADSIMVRDQKLREQQEQLLQSERMAVVGRMASKISHEVRNPLNAMGLNVELLSDEIQSPSGQKTLANISGQIDRLNTIVENYLTMARGVKPKPEKTDITALLSHVEAFLKPEVERKTLQFAVRAEPSPIHILGDTIQLEQAILNLTRNAMEALSPGGKFGIEARQNQAEVQIDVWDSGPGISKDVLPKIFEPFFTTKEKGTGLGLSVTREIVRDQGGTIECESTVGQGTRFKLRFPVAQA